MLAFAVGAGIDWFWQIAAVGAVFFLAAGVITAARCAQVLAQSRRADSPAERHGFGLAVTGLAIAWISALALIGPLLVDHEIKESQNAVARGDLSNAVSHANTARSVEPWAASPYLQLGLIAEQQRQFGTAKERLGQAIEREDRNWQLYYLRSRVEHEGGETAAARADFRHANQLNPRESCLREGERWTCE
jgi:Flp pilus assembly protein TadD